MYMMTLASRASLTYNIVCYQLRQIFRIENILHETTNCQRGSRAKKRGCLGCRIITPRNVGKTLKFCVTL